MATVLVLDGLHRKALALTRWLGRAGHRVLTADTTFWTICRFSRYARRSFVAPAARTQPEAFVEWLLELVERERIDAVLAADDDTTEVLAAHQTRLAGAVGLLLPPLASFTAMRDKGESAAWFARAGIPHPRTIAIQNEAAVPDAAAELGVPLVVKARRSAGSRGLRFVDDLADVNEAYRAVHREYPWPVLQQYVNPGPKFMVCMLYDRSGQLEAAYVEEVLRQYPVSGGPSTLQRSVHRPDLVRLMEPLFALLPWAGPVHADIMVDGVTGQPYVLEVNPRYWQSLHVALHAGVNFAEAHLALAMQQRPVPETVCSGYRAGVYGRALVPFDVLAYLSDRKRRQWNPPFFARYGRDTWDDLLSWSDPGPAFGFLTAVGRYLFDRKMWRDVLRREVARP